MPLILFMIINAHKTHHLCSATNLEHLWFMATPSHQTLLSLEPHSEMLGIKVGNKRTKVPNKVPNRVPNKRIKTIMERLEEKGQSYDQCQAIAKA